MSAMNKKKGGNTFRLCVRTLESTVNEEISRRIYTELKTAIRTHNEDGGEQCIKEI